MDGVYRRRLAFELNLFAADWVPSPMILNLEGKKFVYRLERLGIVRHDSHHCPPLCRHVGVCNLATFLLHHRDARRDRIVDEHWNVKVIRAEHPGDMLEMLSDLAPGGHVRLIIGVDLDNLYSRAKIPLRGPRACLPPLHAGQGTPAAVGLAWRFARGWSGRRAPRTAAELSSWRLPPEIVE